MVLGRMRAAESTVIVYALYAAAAACAIALPARRRLSIVASAGILAATALGAARLDGHLRNWLPALWVLAGYWVSGLFFDTPMPSIERRLLEADRRLCERFDVAAAIERVPRALLEALELSYLLCYPLVPAGFLVLVISGQEYVADKYWTTVLSAELASYGMLPWIQTRPPRCLEPAAPARRRLIFRRLNLWILDRGSIQANTIPSGHAAGATAVALSLCVLLPPAGVVFLTVALAIATASVVGRYHYTVDSIAGMFLGAFAWFFIWR
jgi:hypothetical protein